MAMSIGTQHKQDNALNPKTVVIVEDDAHTRKYLSQAIDNNEQLKLLGSASCCKEALRLLKKQPDIVLMDLELPDGSGIDLIRRFFVADGQSQFVVMTVFGDDQHVIPALEAGATGYLLKDMDPNNIGDMIALLLDGGAPISPSIALKLLKRFHQPESIQSPLTDKEHKVLGLMSKGYNYHESAEHLQISYHTVVSHVRNIYKKLEVHSRSEAIYEASQMGILNIQSE